jgi:FkbM family methyltransferase
MSSMKTVLKESLAAAGFVIQRLPAGIPTGVLFERDLALIVGPEPAATCIDVGANHGDFTATLLAVLPAPRIHAFEPAPATFARLSQRYASDSRVKLTQAGLGDKPGDFSLQIFDNGALNSFLPLAAGAAGVFGTAAQGQESVPVITLDAYAARQGLGRLDLLKIDTQGFELRVLQGALGLLQAGRIRSVLLELNFMSLYQDQAPPYEVMAFLAKYDLHLVDFYEKCRQGPFLGWCTALFTRRPPS